MGRLKRGASSPPPLRTLHEREDAGPLVPYGPLLPLPHPISSNIEDRSYRTLTPCGEGPIAPKCCLGCVLAPIRALSRLSAIYASNRTREVTNWHMFHVCRNFGNYSVSTCAPAVATHMLLRLGMRPPHAWFRLSRPSRRRPTHTASIQASYRRSACTYPHAQPYSWISAHPALCPGRRSRLLASQATPWYRTTTAEPKKPCQMRGYG